MAAGWPSSRGLVRAGKSRRAEDPHGRRRSGSGSCARLGRSRGAGGAMFPGSRTTPLVDERPDVVWRRGERAPSASAVADGAQGLDGSLFPFLFVRRDDVDLDHHVGGEEGESGEVDGRDAAQRAEATAARDHRPRVGVEPMGLDLHRWRASGVAERRYLACSVEERGQVGLAQYGGEGQAVEVVSEVVDRAVRCWPRSPADVAGSPLPAWWDAVPQEARNSTTAPTTPARAVSAGRITRRSVSVNWIARA